MGMDDHYFEPSLGSRPQEIGQVPGSLPVNRLHSQNTPDRGQAYGSLSTFHQVGPATGTSPMSALRAARDMPLQSPTGSPLQKLPPNHRTAQGSKSSLRSAEGGPAYQRRTSVSFQPFKAGSLSSSPAPGSPGSAITWKFVGKNFKRESSLAASKSYVFDSPSSSCSKGALFA
jgi:autophagy-related protein 13